MKELEGFDQFVKDTMEKWQVPGVAIGIVKDDEVIYAEGFGYRDVENELPVTPETIFAIGSSTKSFTATSAGIMVDDGKLDWTTPIRKWIPEFELQDTFASERMTLTDLLCHRSGLPRHDFMWIGTPFTRKEILARLKYLEPSKDFRTLWQYQNLMYLTAGYLAGVANETSWEDLIRERIFKPLGMNNSNLSVTDTQKTDNYALPYAVRDQKIGERKLIDFRNIDNIGPAGSINSNVLDMAKWLIMNLQGGKYKNQQVVSEATLKEIHSAQMPLVTEAMLMPPFETHPEIGQASYGFGWLIQNYRGHRWLHHGGNIDGFNAMISLLPNENYGVVILSNLSGAITLPILGTVLDRLLGLEPLDWNKIWLDFRDEQLKGADAGDEALEKARVADTQPSHALDAYVGEYEHPAYGMFTVELRDGSLVSTYNSMEFQMKHYHYDMFLAKMETFGFTLPLTFSIGGDGSINSVSTPLGMHPAVKPIEFVRKPSPEAEGKAEQD